LKILRQSDSSFDSSDIKTDHQIFINSFNQKCNQKLQNKEKNGKNGCDVDDQNKAVNSDSEHEDCEDKASVKPLINTSKPFSSKKLDSNQNKNNNSRNNMKEYGSNLKELCKKYRDKLTETWIEEEKDDQNCSECCDNVSHQCAGSAGNELSNGCYDERCGKRNNLWIPKFVFWLLKGVFDFVLEKNRFCITEL